MGPRRRPNVTRSMETTLTTLRPSEASAGLACRTQPGTGCFHPARAEQRAGGQAPWHVVQTALDSGPFEQIAVHGSLRCHTLNPSRDHGSSCYGEGVRGAARRRCPAGGRRRHPGGCSPAGFLLKDTPPARIAEAVHQVAAGEPILSPGITRCLMDRVAVQAGAYSRARTTLAALSPREHDVVLAIARGQNNTEIAAALTMTVATVKTHVSHILTKLDLDNRTQIALLAHDAGLA